MILENKEKHKFYKTHFVIRIVFLCILVFLMALGKPPIIVQFCIVFLGDIFCALNYPLYAEDDENEEDTD